MPPRSGGPARARRALQLDGAIVWVAELVHHATMRAQQSDRTTNRGRQSNASPRAAGHRRRRGRGGRRTSHRGPARASLMRTSTRTQWVAISEERVLADTPCASRTEWVPFKPARRPRPGRRVPPLAPRALPPPVVAQRMTEPHNIIFLITMALWSLWKNEKAHIF